MTRELRFKFTGTLFYIVIAANLLLTGAGRSLIRGLPAQVDLYQAVTATVGLGALLFTSEAVGYLFSTIVIFWWNNILGRFRLGFGGYSAEWRKLSYDLKHRILERYESIPSSGDKGVKHSRLEERWKDYSPDVFLSYFWQQAPRPIVEWAMRRHTGFFTGMSAIVGIVLGLLLSEIIIFEFRMSWTIGNTIVIIVSIVLIVFLWLNAQYSRAEAWQIIDLWLSGALDPQMRRTLGDITTLFRPVGQDDTENDGVG